jgi:hypothetical protein
LSLSITIIIYCFNLCLVLLKSLYPNHVAN